MSDFETAVVIKTTFIIFCLELYQGFLVDMFIVKSLYILSINQICNGGTIILSAKVNPPWIPIEQTDTIMVCFLQNPQHSDSAFDHMYSKRPYSFAPREQVKVAHGCFPWWCGVQGLFRSGGFTALCLVLVVALGVRSHSVAYRPFGKPRPLPSYCC